MYKSYFICFGVKNDIQKNAYRAPWKSRYSDGRAKRGRDGEGRGREREGERERCVGRKKVDLLQERRPVWVDVTGRARLCWLAHGGRRPLPLHPQLSVPRGRTTSRRSNTRPAQERVRPSFLRPSSLSEGVARARTEGVTRY